jgi:hypothetical protein
VALIFYYLVITNQKSTFLSANLLTLETFVPLNGATRGPSPMGGTSTFLLYFCCDDGVVGGMNYFGRGNQSTRRKPAPTTLCPPQIPLDETEARTRAAAVGRQRLTASVRPNNKTGNV